MVENGSYHQTMNPGHLEFQFGLNASNFGIIYMIKQPKNSQKHRFSKKMIFFRSNVGI